MGTRIYRIRIPDWAWDTLVVEGELTTHVHNRIEEIGDAQGRVKVRIGKRGRWVWLAKDEVERVAERMRKVKG